MNVVVIMVGKDRKDPIYKGFHQHGWGSKAEGWQRTTPKVTFANFDLLVGDPKAAATSLNEAGAAIAAGIAADLRR